MPDRRRRNCCIQKGVQMLEFGAVVTVVSPEFCPELLELAEQVNTPDKYCAATSDDRGSVENFADYSGCLTLVKSAVRAAYWILTVHLSS